MAIIILCLLLLLAPLPVVAKPASSSVSSAPPPSSMEKTLAGLYTQGAIEMEHLNIEKARKLYQEIDKLAPAKSAHASMGTRARIILKTQLPRYPVSTNCNDMYKQGEVLMHSHDPRDALSVYNELANRYPKFEWAQTAMASLYIRLKDTESAAQCARRALAINENFLQAWMVLIHDALMHNDLDGELSAATRAHQLDPGNEEVGRLLNTLLQEKRKQQPD